MKFSFIFAVALSIHSFTAAADSTFLAQKTISINNTKSSEILDRTVADARMVFQKFQMALDSSSKIIVPKKITGTPTRPVMTITVEKCVFIVCQTIELDAEVEVSETRGKCDRNFMITANLARSSAQLRDVLTH